MGQRFLIVRLDVREVGQVKMGVGVPGHLPDALLEGRSRAFAAAGAELFQALGEMDVGGCELLERLLEGLVFFAVKGSEEKMQADQGQDERNLRVPEDEGVWPIDPVLCVVLAGVFLSHDHYPMGFPPFEEQ
jgi:hypothetical protein